MGLDLWFRDDVKRILAMAAQAAERYPGDFQAGYVAALSDLALAFGVAAPGTRPAIRMIDMGKEGSGREWM